MNYFYTNVPYLVKRRSLVVEPSKSKDPIPSGPTGSVSLWALNSTQRRLTFCIVGSHHFVCLTNVSTCNTSLSSVVQYLAVFRKSFCCVTVSCRATVPAACRLAVASNTSCATRCGATFKSVQNTCLLMSALR